MADNPVRDLYRLGQSLWLDSLRRGLFASGELARMIGEGLRGITSNPTIFEKAILGSPDYDEALGRLAAAGASAGAIYESLVIEDIQNAADLFRPLFDESGGIDGLVSLEVSPKLARDTDTTVAEACRLFERVNRPNVMIKVPGTVEGLPAIERLVALGVPVNVTLLFSVERYDRVIEAYLAGLERRHEEGLPLAPCTSVASFFVSRVDAAVDGLLDEESRVTDDPEVQARLRDLHGQAAIANAKLAYTRFRERFGGERFAALAAKGARVQRPLWASTGTKNPAYGDLYYVEALIGPDTVVTVPPATYAAFLRHGRVRPTLESGLDDARATVLRLREEGIDLAAVTRKLEDQGIALFTASFDALMAGIEQKVAALRARAAPGPMPRQVRLRDVTQTASLGAWTEAVRAAMADLAARDFCRRLWMRDGSLWTSKAAAQAAIPHALGWLTAPETMLERVDELTAFASEIAQAGFTHVLLLGMGGSSLFPDVCRQTFAPAAGRPRLVVLDSTDPVAVRAAEAAVDLPRTLVIVSSKSGTTTEALDFYRDVAARIAAVRPEGQAGEAFVAITDAGTPLERLAREASFRRIFRNPPDIGGRFSALSYFGLVPAVLLGVDVRTLLERGVTMMHAADACLAGSDNAAVELGAILGALAGAGRDKVTFVASPGIAPFADWLEQLLAESTGKEGRGLVPVAGEPLADPSRYRSDRLFVYLRLDGGVDPGQDRGLQALEAAGQPVVTIRLADPLDLGAECFRWSVATTAASALLGVNPFDQPNVQESKDTTNRLLDAYRAIGRLEWEGALPEPEWATALAAHLAGVRPGDYVALMAYLPPAPVHDAALREIRTALRDALRVATTVGYGPRFLHSTGQLHKGGPPTGLFLQLTAEVAEDLAIPGRDYTFGLLEAAQAQGDLLSLRAKGRRVLRLHLGADPAAGLERLRLMVGMALRERQPATA
jgi:transaldolase/glucose-6-phosphate isomerase